LKIVRGGAADAKIGRTHDRYYIKRAGIMATGADGMWCPNLLRRASGSKSAQSADSTIAKLGHYPMEKPGFSRYLDAGDACASQLLFQKNCTILSRMESNMDYE